MQHVLVSPKRKQEFFFIIISGTKNEIKKKDEREQENIQIQGLNNEKKQQLNHNFFRQWLLTIIS